LLKLTGSEEAVAALFSPANIAIIGASSKPRTISWWPLHLLQRHGFRGGIYPVNPGHTEIDGTTCYPSLAAVPVRPDVAMIALDAPGTLAAVRECAALGVKAAVLPTQGFGEMGPDGAHMQAQLLEVARAGNLRLVGPNTDGLANLVNSAFVSIQPLLADATLTGGVALITQSGATAGSLLTRLANEGIGCKYYASTGNEADLGLADYMSVAIQDPDIKIVLSFVESLRKPADFERVAACALRLGKPIALVKVGRSEQGARRAAAHTGSMSGRDQMYDALFARYGIMRVDELAELVAIAKIFLRWGTLSSPGMGIFSVSGGQAGAIADHAVAQGLSVPPISAAAEASLDQLLDFGNGFNPCDLTGEIARKPELASQVYEIFAGVPDIASVVYARKTLAGTVGQRAARQLTESAQRAGAKPLAVYAFDEHFPEEERAIYAAAGIPVFTRLHEMLVACMKLARYGRVASGGVAPEPRKLPDVARAGVEPAPLDEVRAAELLDRYGLTPPATEMAINAEDAVAMAEKIGYPVVVKVADPQVLHKTEIGGVALNLRSAEEVRSAYQEVYDRARQALNGRAPAGISVSEQVSGGVEMLVGGVVDPMFGPFVLVGAGGIWTEILHDVSMRAAPVLASEAREMIMSLRAAPLLTGARGQPPSDVDALVAAVTAVSRLLSDKASELAEIDLNPVAVLPEGRGLRVLDKLLTGFASER